MTKDAQKASLSTRTREAGEMAIEALAWLAEDDRRLEHFLALSGLGPQNLRKAAADPRFLGSIFDYLTSNEAVLVAFAQATARRPEDVVKAHAALSGPLAED